MDEETQRQLTEELRPHLEAQRRTRSAHQRRRDALQEQAARFGIETPVHITQEITDLIIKIREVDARIRETESKIIQLETSPAPETILYIPDEAPRIPTLSVPLLDERLRAQDRAIEWVRDAIAEIRELVDLGREESREWRRDERAARQDGMHDHHGEHRTQRIIMIIGAAVLLILAIGLALIAVKVF